MTKKIDKKGMTIIELLVCFVLVAVITTSLFATLSIFATKRDKESIKSTLFSYKNRVAKEIQYDLVNKSLVYVTIIDPNENTKDKIAECGATDNCEVLATKDNTFFYMIVLKFRDGTEKTIGIMQKTSLGYDVSNCDNDVSDSFYITYGPDVPSDLNKPEEDKLGETRNYLLYKVPNVGSENNKCGNNVRDLRIEEVTVNAKKNVLKLYIGFYHPDLGNEYAIDIVAPMNYFAE